MKGFRQYSDFTVPVFVIRNLKLVVRGSMTEQYVYVCSGALFPYDTWCMPALQPVIVGLSLGL